MPVHLGKQDSDYNCWTINDFHRVLLEHGEYIEVVKNGDNPPTVKQYTRFQLYKTYSGYTIPNDTSTGNNVYPKGTAPTFLNAHAIYEDGADQTFTWGSGNFPSKTDGTWYLYCSDSEDSDASSRGKGEYGASKTETPTYDRSKGGYYSLNNFRILAQFTVSGGTVTLNHVYNEFIYKDSSSDLYIKNNTSDKDIIFKVNDGGTDTEIMRIDGSESKINIGNSQEINLYTSSNNLYIENTVSDGDVLFQVNDGGVTNTTAIFIDGSESFVIIPDGIKLTFGTGSDGKIYSSSDNLYIEQTTQDKDVYFRVNDGGVTTNVIFIDGSESIVQIPDSVKLTLGSGNDGQIYSSSDDLYIDNVTQDKDIVFRVNDGGVTTTLLTLDGDVSNIVIPDSVTLCIGTGLDGKIYSSSDDLYIDNITQDKDIYFRINDGGVTTNAIFIDGSASTLNAFNTLIASDRIEINNSGSGNRYAYIDFHGDDTYTDYGLRIARGNTGANTNTDILHRGTGSLNIQTNDAGNINFRTNGANTRMYIDSGGDVVIADTGTAKLCIGSGKDGQIYSSSDDLYIDNVTQDKDIYVRINDGGVTTNAIFIDGSASTLNVFDTRISDERVAINNNGSGNRQAYLDLVGDVTYPDYGLRIIRNNTGANADSDILHRGTGDINIKTTEAGDINFYTTNTLRGYIGSGGGVTLNDNNPLYLGTAQGIQIYNGSDDLYIKNTTSNKDIIFSINDGGTPVEIMKFAGASSTIQIPDDAKIILGTGQDAQIYSSSDDLYIKGITADKDIIFYVNDGGASTEVLRFNGDDHGIYLENFNGSSGGSDVQYNTGTKQLFYFTSAKRYKENIRNVKLEDVNFIYDIPISKYDRKNGSRKDEVGIIAEDLEALNKDLICYNEHGEVETYNKADLIPYLIKIIQDQNKRLKKLEKVK